MEDRGKRRAFPAITTVLVYLVAVLYFSPIAIAVLNSFKDKGGILKSALAFPDHLSFENYKIVIMKANFFGVFFNSVMLTISCIALIIMISAMAGYAVARWKSKTADILMVIFLSAMFVPFHTIMITLLKTATEVSVTGSFPGLILIYAGLMCPIPIFLYRSFVKSVPLELEESGVMDGAGVFTLAFKIVFPLLKPLSGTVAVINTLWIWNDFLLPYLVLAKPLTIPLSQMYFFGKYNQQWHLIMAGFVISTLPIVIFFLAMQKFIIKGVISGAIKG